jgi:rhodanese-related sulfurtransferase
VTCYTHRSNPLNFVLVHQLGKVQNHTYHHVDSTVRISDIEVNLPDLTASALAAFANEYLLFFWADCTRFFVQPPDPTTFTEHKSVYDNVDDSRSVVYDATGNQVGIACRLLREHWTSDEGGFTHQWYDFVAIGRREISEIPNYPAVILALQVQWVRSVAC